MLTFCTLLAILGYLWAAWLQYRTVQTPASSKRGIKLLASLSILAHTLALYKVLHSPAGIHLGFFIVGSLVGWLVAVVALLSSLQQRVDNLFICIFPLAAASAALAAWGPDLGTARFYPDGLIVHILLSILAYSVFTIATFQAFMLARQNQSLKQHHTRGLVASLPPLQTMENLLFQMLWIGMTLLTASLITGLFFIENFFAQHLAHKTLFSILAWLIYAVLLWGRSVLGWRGQKAIKWTIMGFFLLMLGFFGSKLVLEAFIR